ncbi:MAG: hypothetical protein H7A25_16955 [Leptospiraceae bacterium]|nr:hypothetical protein [Leptospiraceae bacterium]
MEKSGFGLEKSGFGLEKSGFGLEKSGFGLEKSGFGGVRGTGRKTPSYSISILLFLWLDFEEKLFFLFKAF